MADGIPDDFETAYVELLSDLAEIDANGEDLTDVSETDSYKLMAGFYERLPVSARTKAVLAATAEIFEKLAATDTLEKQEELVEKIRKEERQMLGQDPVYVEVKGYMAEILSGQASADTESDADSSGSASSVSRSGGLMVGQTLGRQRISTGSLVDNVALEELNINQIGDVLFKENSPGFHSSYAPAYTMKWGHIALYAGASKIYDAHPDHCSPTSGDGVGLRPLERMYEDADSVMYAQLNNESWRSSQAGAVSDAKASYGTVCSTPFTRNAFAMGGTSKFFCSKLVWRIYLDNDDHAVNVDSNGAAYHYWLQDRYPALVAALIIIDTVAPDEIAFSPNLDNYRTLD